VEKWKVHACFHSPRLVLWAHDLFLDRDRNTRLGFCHVSLLRCRLVSPSQAPACTGDRENRSSKPLSLWSYTGRGWIVSPSQAPVCTGDRESRSSKPSSLWSYTRRGWISYLESALRVTAPSFHDGSSSMQVRWRYILAYSSSTALSSSSSTHCQLCTTINNNISTTSTVASLCRRKVHPVIQCHRLYCLI
jgi:hypothetical protein